MSSPEPATPADDILPSLIEHALKAGADAAEAILSEREALSVGVRNSALEEVEREESRDLSLRVFVGRRQAVVSSSSLSADARRRLVERAVAMAALAPEDPFGGLADASDLAVGPFPDLDLHDATERSPEALEATARETEAAALAIAGVSRSEGADAAWSRGRWRLVTSEAFDAARQHSRFSLSASVIAEKDGVMERAGEGRAVRHLSDLIGPGDLGRRVGERAAAKIGARKIGSTTAPVIFENRIAAALLSPLLGAVSGPSVARGTSFLKDRLGQRVLPQGVSLLDDPFRPRGLGSTPFDDEGVRVAARAIVEDGVIATWLLNTASARQLGLRSTGHGARGSAGPAGVSVHNAHLTPGRNDLAGLMAQADRGLLVTGMFGPSLNANTGDWSAGVNGFWFEGGDIVHPVSEMTVAGNLTDLYARLVPGADLEFHDALNSPSLLFDAVAIAGK